jgi:hypothetical protein
MANGNSTNAPLPTWATNLCLGIPTRSVRPGENTSTVAELYVYFNYLSWFQGKYASGIVLPQTDFVNVRTRIPLVDAFLDAMADDFKNVFSNKSVAAARKAGDLSKLRPGGFRKPDMLGIARDGEGVLVELVEVTTDGEAPSTIREDLGEKLDTLNNLVLPILVAKLTERLSQTLVSVRIRPSPWRPSPGQLIYPLPTVAAGAAASGQKVEWLCYKPTFRRFPPNGTDGLVLYEVHSVGTPQLVPKEVVDRLKSAYKRVNQPVGPHLLPWAQNYWQSNPADRDVVLLALGVAGVAVVALLVVAFLPEVAVGGLVAGAVEAADVAVAAEATPGVLEAVSTILQGLGRMAPAL